MTKLQRVAQLLDSLGFDESSEAVTQLQADLIATQKERDDWKARSIGIDITLEGSNERLRNAELALAAHNVAWDAVIQPCYDELKKALGRDIECPAYIPDAIRELAALRGEPVAWRWKRTPDDKWSWHLSNEKPNTPWVKAIIEPLYAAPISGEQLSAPARFLAAEGEYERRMDAVSGERK